MGTGEMVLGHKNKNRDCFRLPPRNISGAVLKGWLFWELHGCFSTEWAEVFIVTVDNSTDPKYPQEDILGRIFRAPGKIPIGLEFCMLTGYKQTEVLGSNILDCLPPSPGGVFMVTGDNQIKILGQKNILGGRGGGEDLGTILCATSWFWSNISGHSVCGYLDNQTEHPQNILNNVTQYHV